MEDPDRRRRIEDLYRAARDPARREALLASADGEERCEVEALLRADETRTASAAGEGWTDLGPYRLEGPLGAGGVGEVFRARDTRLDRTVAVKLLRGQVASDATARVRFRREARAASALNHPNICTVHDVGEDGGRPYLVMECLEGETLQRRLEHGPLPLDVVVEVGAQVADALEAAHAHGIVHRDVKPSNVFLTSRGPAKVMDFGLAKLDDPGGDDERAATLTATGAAVGTMAYMSPEQARGEPVDARTDLFSLGVMLYEMATGTRPFRGASQALLSDAILNRAPIPPRTLRADLPPQLEAIILMALEKDRERRTQSAADMVRALRDEALPSSKRAERSAAGVERRRPASSARKGSSGVRARSVAVLYFENLSGAEDDEYFRDGMTEDIITELAKIKSLHVFPRAAVLAFRDTPATGPEVGKRVGAAYVLGGGLRRAGNRLRITAQMVETRTGQAVWAERYDRDMKDVLDVQEDIARSIAQALRISLSPQEVETIARKPTENLRAYDYFLRGRNYTRRGAREFALEMFEHALQLDPDFVLAHAGIANVCAMQYYLQGRAPHWIERGVAAVGRVLELDPQLPEAFVARARIAYAQGKYEEAAEHARTAIALKTDCDGSWDILGRALFASDRWQEAADLVERALDANGDDYNVYVPFGNALSALGRREARRALDERAVKVLEHQVEWVPEDTRARIILANAYAMLARPSEAVRELERVLALGPTDPHTVYNVACTYALLLRKQESLAVLRKAVEAGYSEADPASRDPDLAILHGEPEFERLLEQMKREK